MGTESERKSGIYVSQMNKSIIVVFGKVCLFKNSKA